MQEPFLCENCGTPATWCTYAVAEYYIAPISAEGEIDYEHEEPLQQREPVFDELYYCDDCKV